MASLQSSDNEMLLIQDLSADFDFLKKRQGAADPNYEGLWGKRLKIWFSILSEVPRNPYYKKPILSQIYQFLRMDGYNRTCILNYEKLADDASLDWESFNHVGKPIYLERDNRKFNERSLRHLRTVSIIKEKIPLEAGDYVLDVGGGYAQFAMCLRRQFPKIKCVLESRFCG